MAKTLIGKIISTKMQKTIVVSVERIYQHSLYKKIIRKHKKYKAHNEKLDLKEGDTVKIQETRPYSADKHFKAIEKIAN